MNKKFIRCPQCSQEGKQLDNNKLVWHHVTTDNKGQIETHKWSINTGRMFRQEATEDDSVW